VNPLSARAAVLVLATLVATTIIPISVEILMDVSFGASLRLRQPDLDPGLLFRAGITGDSALSSWARRRRADSRIEARRR